MNLNFELLDQSLDILGGAESSAFLKEVKANSKSITVDHQKSVLLYNGKTLLEKVFNLKARFIDTLSNPSRLLTPRLQFDEDDQNKNVDISDLIRDVCDTEQNVIVNSLKNTPYSLLNNDTAPSSWSKTLVLVGSLYLAYLDVDYIKKHFSRIIVVESSPLELCLALSCGDFPALINKLKSNKIGLQMLVDNDVENLKAKFRDQVLAVQPTCTYGMTLCHSPLDNPTLTLFSTWLQSPEGLTQSVAGALGKETDEINQLIQALVNAKNNPIRKFLTSQSADHLKPVVLVASGPSLDESIPWLQKYQNQLQIVCAGSSLGTVLSEGIRPSAVVFLERSSVVYETDLYPLVENNTDLSSILLIASMTIDPRISSLFDDTVWFHRPISSVLTFFEDEASAKLLQSGPHSANAALESLLHCGFKKILCIGCDFSAQKRSYPRSKNALGDSPRDLDIPILGRNGKTVFSSATLLDASYYFANAASVYQAKIYSVKSGVELSGIDMTLVDLDDSLANEFSNTDELYTLLGAEISTCLDQKGFALEFHSIQKLWINI